MTINKNEKPTVTKVAMVIAMRGNDGYSNRPQQKDIIVFASKREKFLPMHALGPLLKGRNALLSSSFKFSHLDG